MRLVLAWVVFPATLLALCTGCGLLVDRLSGRDTERSLISPVGFAAMIVIGTLCTMQPATAALATPVTTAAAALGFASNHARLRGIAHARMGLIAAAAVFAAYGAPVILSGHPTFAGYIKLDDSATWMALTDRIVDHGRDISGIAPSTYSATLSYSLAEGYPVGSLLPWGIGRALVGQDLAWLLQPYLALMAALLAMAAWSMLRPVIQSARWRAAAVFVACQPALLYGYALWGGVKELAAATCIAATAALVPGLLTTNANPLARTLPLVTTTAATLAVSSAGGALWIAPMLLAAFVLLVRAVGARSALIVSAAFAAAGLVLALPALRALSFVLDSRGELTRQAGDASSDAIAAALGNLGDPLKPLQVVGVWPAADFRTDPISSTGTHVLIALVVAAAIVGLAYAYRRRAWGLLLYASATGFACLVITRYGSPWIDAKALATASPILLVAAAATVGLLLERRKWPLAAVVGAAISAGVIWSNALAYGGVNLGPYDQLRELQQIGAKVAGDGPTLMTEYQTYGVRHLLRKADAEGSSELRVRPVFLTTGGTLGKAAFGDVDEIQLASLLEYRTLVLRRSPVASRPPVAFKLVESGRWYDVWQRDESAPQILQHVGLGSALSAAGSPDCAQLRALATRGGRLATVFRPPVVVVQLNTLEHPPSWSDPAGADLVPGSQGSARGTFYIANPGAYRVWLGGSVRSRIEVLIDGRSAGSERAHLNVTGQWSDLGRSQLAPGRHSLELRYAGPDLAPGSAGVAPPLGPLALSLESDRPAVSYVPSANASSLCGKSLDWLEAVR